MIEIRLLGRVSVTVDDQPLTGEAAQRRRLALLALLCTSPPKPVGRDRLMVHLWPENDGESARHLLSSSLHVLRKALGSDAVLTTGDQVELNAERVRVDVRDFDDAVRRGDCEAAVALYGGPFLEGLYISSTPDFEQWVDGRRAELARQHEAALEGCAQLRASGGDMDGAVEAWRRLAALDPYSARTTLGLMNALAAAGNRAAALQAARVHEQLLEAEFSAAPEPEVLRLSEQLRQEPPPAAPAAVPDTAEVPGDRAAAAVPAPKAEAAEAPTAADPPAPAHSPFERMRVLPIPPRQVSRRRIPGRRVPVAAVVAFIVVVTAVVTTVLWKRTSLPAPEPGVIAVVPLAGRGGDASDDYLAAGIAWHVIDALGRSPRLRIVNSASSFMYRDSQQDPRVIGQQLRADGLVTVSVRTSGEQIRVAVELVRTSDGLRRWGSQHEGRRDRIFAMEDAVASAVAAALDVPVPVAGRMPVKGEAHELYLQGRHAWNRRTPSALLDALALFQQAVDVDPTYAWGHVGVADTYNMLGSYDYGVLAPDSAFPRARAAAERALSLVPDFEPAHAAIANVRMNYDWDWAGAEKSFRRAIELNPGYTPSSEWLAGLLIARRRLPEAMALLQQAAEYNPASPLMFTNLAHYHYYAREPAIAMRYLDQALRLDPGFGRAHVLRGLVLCQAGQVTEAIALFEELARRSREDDPIVAGLLGYAYAIAGRQTDALAQAEWLAARARVRHQPVEYEALVYQGLGDAERVFALLDIAMERRSGSLVYLQVEPLMDNLRHLPRFRDLATRVHGESVALAP
ncbi:MAG TPA: tetratricopeptide repeat protein [Longimicrobiales bacterium]|nr:tetratricopeptide repeat protein [Longimicrobiales bacterium]